MWDPNLCFYILKTGEKRKLLSYNYYNNVQNIFIHTVILSCWVFICLVTTPSEFLLSILLVSGILLAILVLPLNSWSISNCSKASP